MFSAFSFPFPFLGLFFFSSFLHLNPLHFPPKFWGVFFSFFPPKQNLWRIKSNKTNKKKELKVPVGSKPKPKPPQNPPHTKKTKRFILPPWQPQPPGYHAPGAGIKLAAAGWWLGGGPTKVVVMGSHQSGCYGVPPRWLSCGSGPTWVAVLRSLLG